MERWHCCSRRGACLLNPNRNPDLKQPKIEQRLRDFPRREARSSGSATASRATTRTATWTTSRASSAPTTIVTARARRMRTIRIFEPLKANHDYLAGLTDEAVALARRWTTKMSRPHGPVDPDDGLPARFQIIKLPMPRKITRTTAIGCRRPTRISTSATSVVLLPAYADANDRWAAAILEKAFPGTHRRAR